MSAQAQDKPAKDVIYVDVEDEITGIIDKVENSEHKVVALVLPKRAASLQSIVNMKLLKRSADSSGKNVVLITSEKALMPLAGAAGLHVARNLQSRPEVPDGPAGLPAAGAVADEDPTEEVPENTGNEDDLPGKFDYEKPVGALAAAHEAENPETIDLDDDEDDAPKTAPKKSAVEKVRVPNFDRFRLMMGLAAAGVIALIVFIILALFILPKGAVTIHTASEPVAANFNLTANAATTSLDTAKGLIPAKLESADQTGTQQVTATGQQNNGTKATGSVTMTTCVSSSPQDVPAGTGVSANGLTYVTQEKATFSFTFSSCSSGGFKFQSNSVDITANQGGAKYNTSLSGASVAGFSSTTADGSASGGTDNIVTVLTQGDLNGATQKLTSGTTADDFTKNFKQKLDGQGEYVLGSTLKPGDPVVTSTPSVGQPASTANVSIKITYTVLTVKKTDLSQAIEAKLAGQIDKTKQKLSDSSLNDADVTVQNQPSPNAAILNLDVNTTAVPIISIAAVKKQAEGKKAGDIEQAINNWPGVKSVDVKLSPFWVSKVPGKDSKVTVKLVEDKASPSSGAP